MSDETSEARPRRRSLVTYEVPLDAQLARCRGCGAAIYWTKTEKGKNVPVNPGDRTSHFTTCPKAADFSRRKHNEPHQGSDRQGGQA